MKNEPNPRMNLTVQQRRCACCCPTGYAHRLAVITGGLCYDVCNCTGHDTWTLPLTLPH